MDLTKAQVLITGGSEGIGRALAERFLKEGSRVIVTGRSVDKLEKTAAALPGLEYAVSDIGQASARIALAEYIRHKMPGINILINNAGIQRRTGLAADHAPWSERQQEIDILLAGPVHLNDLLIPLLSKRESLIVNVTSGGAYIPQVFAPLYSACKAALHHYTMVLRHALQKTPCRVVELVPPAVQTALAGPGNTHGADLETFADQVFAMLTASNTKIIGYGPTADIAVSIFGKPQSELMEASAARFPVEQYE